MLCVALLGSNRQFANCAFMLCWRLFYVATATTCRTTTRHANLYGTYATQNNSGGIQNRTSYSSHCIDGKMKRKVAIAAAAAFHAPPCAEAFCSTRSGARSIKRSRGSGIPPRRVFDGPWLEPEPESSQPAPASTQFIIDKILDECLRYSARNPIMRQFDPNRSMWRRWKGTVVAETWKSAARRVVWTCAVYLLLRKHPEISSSLDGTQRIWTELIAIVTFTLTFFVNEAYSCWRNCLNICYNLQGRLNDFGMALAGCAKRDEPRLSSSSSSKRAMQAAEDVEATSKFTPGARNVLTIISRYVRLFNILCYASFARSHRPLLTPQGMRRMVTRGLLTEKEHTILINSRVAATARHNEVLMWMFRTALDARRAGHFYGGYGFEQNLLLRIQEIRGEGNYMEAILRGRMPFFYAHIVRILVGFITIFYPFVAFSSGLSLTLGIAGVVFLSLTYQGLFTADMVLNKICYFESRKYVVKETTWRQSYEAECRSSTRTLFEFLWGSLPYFIRLLHFLLGYH